MNKPFDLVAAKRGERIQFAGKECCFIGKSEKYEGLLVIETGSSIIYVRPDELHMAPKKATARYRNFKVSDGTTPSVGIVTDRDGSLLPSEIENMSWFVGWIDFEWQTVEVEL